MNGYTISPIKKSEKIEYYVEYLPYDYNSVWCVTTEPCSSVEEAFEEADNMDALATKVIQRTESVALVVREVE